MDHIGDGQAPKHDRRHGPAVPWRRSRYRPTRGVDVAIGLWQWVDNLDRRVAGCPAEDGRERSGGGCRTKVGSEPGDRPPDRACPHKRDRQPGGQRGEGRGPDDEERPEPGLSRMQERHWQNGHGPEHRLGSQHDAGHQDRPPATHDGRCDGQHAARRDEHQGRPDHERHDGEAKYRGADDVRLCADEQHVVPATAPA